MGVRAFSGKRRYNIKLWKTFTDCFNCLPVAAIVDEKIFCMHGGLSPELNDMEQIKRVLRPTDVPDTGKTCKDYRSHPFVLFRRHCIRSLGFDSTTKWRMSVYLTFSYVVPSNLVLQRCG